MLFRGQLFVSQTLKNGRFGRFIGPIFVRTKNFLLFQWDHTFDSCHSKGELCNSFLVAAAPTHRLVPKTITRVCGITRSASAGVGFLVVQLSAQTAS